ncbi:MAG: hypothetical protein JOZ87_01330, partial [Chloroflexi bacterium]|nr:hypothetical protein [Chloroflexota bacterium]
MSTTELDSAGNPVNGAVAVPIVVQTVDLATGQVQTVSTPQSLPDGTPLLQSDEVVTGITTLVDGTIVLTIDPVIGAVNETNPTRIVLLRATPVALSVSGLKQDEQLGDVAGTSDGSLLGLVMKKNGTPPADLAQIDLGTGALTTVNKIQLPRNRSFRTLTQCPDGTLYTTAVQNGGDTNLVHLDLGQNKAVDSVTLTSNGSVWNSGLESLMCTGG